MNESKEIRLCGGILFAVLLTCVKQRTRHNSFGSTNTDGLDQVSTLYGIAKIVDPSFDKPERIGSNIPTTVSRYKSCEGEAEGVMPFSDKLSAEAFDNEVKTNWLSAIARMRAFCNEFLSLDSRKKNLKLAVTVLVELLKRDSSIANEQQFYVMQDGGSISKKEIGSISKVMFEPFILGILHFIVTQRQNNTVGANTYSLLFPSKAGGKRPLDITRLGSSLVDIEVGLYEADDAMPGINEPENEAFKAEVYEHGIPNSKTKTSFTQNNFNGSIGQYIEKADSVVNINYAK